MSDPEDFEIVNHPLLPERSRTSSDIELVSLKEAKEFRDSFPEKIGIRDSRKIRLDQIRKNKDYVYYLYQGNLDIFARQINFVAVAYHNNNIKSCVYCPVHKSELHLLCEVISINNYKREDSILICIEPDEEKCTIL